MEKFDAENVVYDVDTEFISSVSSKCSSVSSSINSATIEVPALVAKYASGVLTTIQGKSEISSAVGSLQSTLLGMLASAGASDVSYGSDGSNGMGNNFINREGMKVADLKFFEDLSKTNSNVKVSNGVVTIGNYTYNIKNKKLSWGDSQNSSIKVEFYIPKSNINYSESNTVTMLAPSGSASMATNNYFKNYSSNSVLVVPYKYNKTYSYTNLKQNATGKEGQNMTDQVINSTEFIKACTNQKSECKNYIVGLSNGGGSALKIGASNTYDGTVVVNYKPLIDGYSPDTIGDKGDRLNVSDLDSYNTSDKPILFVSSAKDGSKGVNNIELVEDGIEKILKDYPGMNVKWATNNQDILSKNKSYVIPKEELWNDVATNKGDGVSDNKDKLYAKQYTGHGAFSGLTRDFINGGRFDGNNYNKGISFEW